MLCLQQQTPIPYLIFSSNFPLLSLKNWTQRLEIHIMLTPIAITTTKTQEAQAQTGTSPRAPPLT